MPTHIALLRGINLGGHKKIAMAELRDLVASLGHGEVATYIQSGNVLFTPRQAGAHAAELAAGLEQAVAAALGVQAGVVVLSRAELAQVVADNPYTGEPDPRCVHAIFLPAVPGPGEAAAHADWLAAAERQAAGQDGRDEVRLVGRVVFLHTPDGYGTSELARLLGRSGGPLSARTAGTARNWSTVTRLLALCDGPARGAG
jgi:uncharacterized protein (DUF1697 family)